MNVAARERLAKEKNPELFCADPRCLWRVVTSQGPNPCRKHPQLRPGKPLAADTE